MSEAKTTSFNAWISENAIRLMRSLNTSAPLNEDAFQDAYLRLASTCRKQERSAVFERAFVAAYRKFARKSISETYTTIRPDELFFTLLPTPQETEASERRSKENKENLAQAIKAYIKTNYSHSEVAIWELRMNGTDMRTMSVNRKSGSCLFNTKAIRDFDLRPDNRVVIAKDTDSKNDWYVTFVEPENETGTRLRVGRNGKDERIYDMRTQNKAASGAILDSVNATYSATFIIAATPTKMPDGTTWYRVLTSNPVRTN